MAMRTWVKLLLATLGVGALAGASQLGLAYGLGILRLTRVLDVTTRDQWTAQLAWVAWFAMLAAVIGAQAGSWLLPRWAPGSRPAAAPPAPGDPAAWPTAIGPAHRPEQPAPGTGTIVALAVAAGIGAAVVVPLTMQPARTAQVAGVDAVVVIAVCAALGAVVGIVAACATVAQAVARWSVAVVGLAVWVIALVSVFSSFAPSDPLPAVRLGVFDAGFLSAATIQRMALFTMPVLALLAGSGLGWLARRQGRPTLTIALAGLPGPALLTLAYLIAGPGGGGDRYQVVPYWAAMTATGAGVLGSVLAAVLRRDPAPDAAGDDDEEGAGETLPRRSTQPDPAIARTGTGPAVLPAEQTGRSAAGPPPWPDTSPERPAASPWAGTDPARSAFDTAQHEPDPARYEPADPFTDPPAPAPASWLPGAGDPGHRDPPPFDGFAHGEGPWAGDGRARRAAPREAVTPTARGGLGWGMRSLDRTSPPTADPVAEDPTGDAGPARPTAGQQPPAGAHAPEPDAAPRRPSRDPAQVPEQRQGSGQPPQPAANQPTPTATHRSAPAQPTPATTDRTPPDDPAEAPATKPGRRGLRKRQDNNDYVDWVSGLGND